MSAPPTSTAPTVPASGGKADAWGQPVGQRAGPPTLHSPATAGIAPTPEAVPADSAAAPPPPGPTPEPTPSFSPLYQQIKGLILSGLQVGKWKPGEMIPSELELAAAFQVSQGTVRKAVDELAAENLLTRRQGRGTFVATHTERHVSYRFLRLEPDNGTLLEEGPAQRDLISCKRGRACAEVARALGLKSAEAVLEVKRLLSFGGAPVILEDIWLPASPFKGLTAERLTHYHGPMYALFESEFGVKMVRADEKIRAVLPEADQAALLQVSSATPLLSVWRIAYTYHDTPMELRRGLYRTDSHYYRNALG